MADNVKIVYSIPPRIAEELRKQLAVRVVTPENRATLTPDEYEELTKLSDICTENQTIPSGARMFRNMLKHMDSRQWALIDTHIYGFDMGKGPIYPLNCYRQSFMGYFMPES